MRCFASGRAGKVPGERGKEGQLGYATRSDHNQIQNSSLAELVRQLAAQTARMAHQEVELARAELDTAQRRPGAVQAVSFYALGAFAAAAVLGLATAIAAWLAALIVATVLAAGAAALAVYSQVRGAAWKTANARHHAAKAPHHAVKAPRRAQRETGWPPAPTRTTASSQ